MKYFFLSLIALSFVQYSHSECKLQSSEVIKIGCTYDQCGFFNRFALKNFARDKKYNIEFISIDKKALSSQQVDAVLIPGGADINPNYYATLLPKETDLTLSKLTPEGKKRDPIELGLLEKYFSLPKSKSPPLLGICRGMQAISIAQGVPLILDLKTQLNLKNRIYTIDKVTQRAPSSIFTKHNEAHALELHHQAMDFQYYLNNKDRFQHFTVTALSNDGIIPEILEFKDRPVLGVQFHPELSLGKLRKNVFNWFLDQACQYKNSQKENT